MIEVIIKIFSLNRGSTMLNKIKRKCSTKYFYSILSELIQIALLVVSLVTDYLYNYTSYMAADYDFKQITNSTFYFVRKGSILTTETVCTTFSKSDYGEFINFKYPNGIGWFVIATYWISFALLCSLQIHSFYGRTFLGRDKSKTSFKYMSKCAKIFFAPSHFLVSSIDYESPCINMGLLGMWSIYVASVGICFQYLLPIYTGCFYQVCQNECEKCNHDHNRDRCNNKCTYYLIGAYMFLSFVIYVLIYFGKFLAVVENILITLNITIDIGQTLAM
jgi:hypothetical protein